jgi:methylenetetrahydrofolate reductase (NADPH)
VKLIDLIKNADGPFYSLEFFPPKEAEQLPGFFAAADALLEMNPLFASVTYGAGGGSQVNTLEVARRLTRDCGYRIMPHLTCVGSSKERIVDYLEQLRSMGISNVLTLRGDVPKHLLAGDGRFDWSREAFRHASELADFVREAFPDFGLGVAAYPAPHPESTTLEEDRGYTSIKLRASDFAITQIFFDVREYIDMRDRLLARGVDKPILPGLLPIQSFESLRHVLALCGANIPARLYIALEEANRRGGAEAVREAGLRFAVEQIRRLLDAGAPGIHLYTLNKAETCLRIAEAVGGLRKAPALPVAV